jgi:hypothetical protein
VTARDALESLRNVEGVYGAFVVDHQGNVLARDLSAVIPTAGLVQVGQRLPQLWTALHPREANELVLRFSSHQLFAVRVTGGSLAVLAGPRVRRSALRLACRMVERWLEDRCPPCDDSV